MWIRILIAGFVGGVLIFCAGAFSHMVLGLQGRTLKNLPDSGPFMDDVRSRALNPGIYLFPEMPTGADGHDPAKYTEANEKYKAGPAGWLLIVPAGDDMMSLETLGKELASNIIAALLASWVVSLLAADVGFFHRWAAVLIIGLIGWFSFIASYGIWYRFPHAFVHDEFLGGAVEWGLAGLAIAAIVRRPLNATAQPTVNGA